jgi:hypothetical protein
MVTDLTSKSSPAQSSQFYRCPGCNESVDGGQLSEVLVHHQHVLDCYRLRIMRGFDAPGGKADAQAKAKG